MAFDAFSFPGFDHYLSIGMIVNAGVPGAVFVSCFFHTVSFLGLNSKHGLPCSTENTSLKTQAFGRWGKDQ